jgi:hypothetical protein
MVPGRHGQHWAGCPIRMSLMSGGEVAFSASRAACASLGSPVEEMTMHPRGQPTRITTAAVVTGIVIVAAAGCGAAGAPSGGSGTLTPPSVNNSPTRTGSAPGSPPAHGILECVSGQIAMIDPLSGMRTWTESIAAPSLSGWTAAGCPGFRTPEPPYDLEDFSVDLRRVVASGGGHVGWVDVSTGAVTDVSGITTPPTPTFGAPPAPIDSDPKFDPKDNSFWFVRSGTSILRVPDGGSEASTVAVRNLAPGATNDWGISAGSSLVDFGILQSNAPGYLLLRPWVNPDATVAIGGEYSTGTQVTALPNVQWRPATITGDDSTAFGRPTYVSEFDWITDTQILCNVFSSNSNGTATDLLTYSPGTGAFTAATLLSSNFAMNSDFLASPDGSTVAFLSNNQGQTTPYTIALSNLGGQPAPIGPLGSANGAVMLLAWR